MKDKVLNYYNLEDMRPYIGLEYQNMYTEQVGNTFYIMKREVEKKHFKAITNVKTVLYIVMCCGVHEQTLIDILKSYGFDVAHLEK